MISYRIFHNADPPKIVDLWHDCGLGPGAAEGFSYDALELLNFSQPFFEKRGFIIATVAERVVGMVHAGFGVNDPETALNFADGVICAVMVRPAFRRRGIGRELLRRACQYLRERGATSIRAGGTRRHNPFYVGLYGGSQPSGFLESDADAAPFLRECGFQPVEREGIYRRDMEHSKDPVHFRLVQNRRKFELAIMGQPEEPSWWWLTRFGRLDSLRFQLVQKGGGPAVAGVTVIGLDLYFQKWQRRAVGLTDLFVEADERRQGYAQTLLIEVCRRLREELVGIVEIHAPATHMSMCQVVESAGFTRVDEGVSYELLADVTA